VPFLAAADFYYRPEAIYPESDTDDVFVAVLAILMTGALLLGMLRRVRHDIAGIGFETALVLLLYALSGGLMLA
jgi:cation:H+ antiporter